MYTIIPGALDDPSGVEVCVCAPSESVMRIIYTFI